MLYIDYDDVRDEMPAVIEKYGSWDKHYEPLTLEDDTVACGYVDYDNKPSCLVGCYLIEKGISLYSLSQSDTRFLPVHELAELFADRVKFTQQALDALCDIQGLQDQDTAWGTAYEKTFEPTKDRRCW